MTNARAQPTIGTAISPGAKRGSTGDVAADARPRRRSNVRSRVVEGEVIVLDRQYQLVHQFNRTAGYIWDRCDGQHSVATIAGDLTQVFDVDLETAKKDVAHAVRQFEAAGLIETASA
jgi:Coenzyme PQQ synthesis protein D (PqqD)